jgi:hypothetical protein
MNCEDARLKLQSIIDNELAETEIDKTISHMESCYKCRKEYIDFLKLKKRVSGSFPHQEDEWYEKTAHKISRKLSSFTGSFLFLGSYTLLIVYLVLTLFQDKETEFIIKIGIAGIVLGFFVLLGITLVDRIREKKDDKYKGVIK